MSFRQSGREVRNHRRVMMKSHRKSKWCSRSAYLCKNPKHYRWSLENYQSGSGWTLGYGMGRQETPRIMAIPQSGIPTKTDDETFQYVVEQAMLAGDRLAYKALCIVAFNNPDYAEYQKSCLANYERIVNSPIPNRKLKRQI